AGRCRRGRTGLRRADHDARAFRQIACIDLRLLPIGDAELHEVRGARAVDGARPEPRHAAGLRTGWTRTTWSVRAARTAGEATEATSGTATRRGRTRHRQRRRRA